MEHSHPPKRLEEQVEQVIVKTRKKRLQKEVELQNTIV